MVLRKRDSKRIVLEGASLALFVAMKSNARRSSVRKFRSPSGRSDDGNAFVPDTIGQLRPIPAVDAEAFAEEFIGSATTAESVKEDAVDEVVVEEDGGPFIVLDDDARLPASTDERKAEREGAESMQREQSCRGARWAARGL